VPFLTCFDEVEEHGGDALEALTYLVFKQIELRVRKEADRASFVRDYSALNDISRIVAMFTEHFSLPIAGSSRLPVLAIYAIYIVMMDQVGRFEGKTLRELELHSAADQRTGALGDIEVISEDDTVFEGLEIKHGLLVTEAMINSCARKIEGVSYPVDRYYILTTHAQCTPTPEMVTQLESLAKWLGCQIVVNGVTPTIKYYLRLLTEPRLVLPVYQDLLEGERAISHEHAVAWNEILRRAVG
jgi:DNA (cytosine-5)-methyltransferase 1